MQKIDLKNKGFIVNGKAIESANICQIKFKTFMDFIDEMPTMKSQNEVDKYLSRRRLIEQATLVADDGSEIKLDAKTIQALPPKLGILLRSETVKENGLAGEVINDGNGIDSPVLYRLGTPIKEKNGEIVELEFQAKTYGDLEDALAENGLKRAYKLIISASVPVFANDEGTKLLRTPEAIAEKMELIDGMSIAAMVAPIFLDTDAS